MLRVGLFGSGLLGVVVCGWSIAAGAVGPALLSCAAVAVSVLGLSVSDGPRSWYFACGLSRSRFLFHWEPRRDVYGFGVLARWQSPRVAVGFVQAGRGRVRWFESRRTARPLPLGGCGR